MQNTLLIIAVVLLSLLLIILTFVYILRQSGGKKQRTAAAVSPAMQGFEVWAGVLTTSGSSEAALREAVGRLLEEHGDIHDEERLERYRQLIMALCIHPHTTKELILAFDRGLGSKNPAYRDTFNKALRQGLAARDGR